MTSCRIIGNCAAYYRDRGNDKGRALVLGIGINLLNSAFPPEVQQIATSVQLEISRSDLETILRHLMIAIERRYEMLQSAGGAAIIREWSARSSFGSENVSGQQRTQSTRRDDARAETDGALVSETDEGGFELFEPERYRLRAFGV